MSVQDSLYRMGEAALAAVPEILEISMACPNMHFIPINLSAFGLDNHNDVFLPTDEPHGQIECTVGRGEVFSVHPLAMGGATKQITRALRAYRLSCGGCHPAALPAAPLCRHSASDAGSQ